MSVKHLLCVWEKHKAYKAWMILAVNKNIRQYKMFYIFLKTVKCFLSSYFWLDCFASHCFTKYSKFSRCIYVFYSKYLTRFNRKIGLPQRPLKGHCTQDSGSIQTSRVLQSAPEEFRWKTTLKCDDNSTFCLWVVKQIFCGTYVCRNLK